MYASHALQSSLLLLLGYCIIKVEQEEATAHFLLSRQPACPYRVLVISANMQEDAGAKGQESFAD